MCEYCDNIKKVAFDKGLSEDEKIKKLEEETLKEIFLDFLDANEDIGIPLNELGLTQEDLDNAPKYELNDNDFNHEKDVFKKKEEFKLISLYKYDSNAYGTKRYGDHTRRFCKMLVDRTSLSLMRKQDIDALNGSNPGFGQGGSDNYSVFNWRGGSNCKHFWVKYFYDTDSMQMVKAPFNQQPIQQNKGDV